MTLTDIAGKGLCAGSAGVGLHADKSTAARMVWEKITHLAAFSQTCEDRL
jgi:hypothetical protein